MAKFYKQELGVLIPPPGFDKWHLTWTLDNIISGFRRFFEENGRWPIAQDLQSCTYLPNVKTIERKFGGIVQIRQKLGVQEPHFNAGSHRSDRATELWKRGFGLEEKVYQFLVERFHEPFVHNQGRINLGGGVMGRADCIVFHRHGKFLVDVFYPDTDYQRFINNMISKVRHYSGIPLKTYIVVGNPEITKVTISRYINSRKSGINKNIDIMTVEDFSGEVQKYEPLDNPYGS